MSRFGCAKCDELQRLVRAQRERMQLLQSATVSRYAEMSYAEITAASDKGKQISSEIRSAERALDEHVRRAHDGGESE